MNIIMLYVIDEYDSRNSSGWRIALISIIDISIDIYKLEEVELDNKEERDLTKKNDGNNNISIVL